MRDVAFVNHLRLGSASSFRQAGLAKYLDRLGTRGEFIGRGDRDSAQEESLSPEWDCFERLTFWEEPLTTRFRRNVLLFKGVAKDARVLHVNRANPYTATVASIGRSRTNKLVVDMEDWDGFGGYSTYAGLYGAKGLLLTFYEGTFPRTGDLVLSVSHLLSARMVQLGVPRSKILLVPNGYDEELFDPATSGRTERELYGLGDSPVVIYMSTYWTFERGQHELALDAFREVARRRPEARLLMVGGGNLDVSPLVAARGLEGKVAVTGFVARARIPALIAAADVALHVISGHPYHQASSPMVMPEYMAMGKAIVAPRIGELGYALTGGAGLLVDVDSPEALASGVTALLKDDARRREIGETASRRAREEFSYRSLAAKLDIAYTRLREG